MTSRKERNSSRLNREVQNFNNAVVNAFVSEKLKETLYNNNTDLVEFFVLVNSNVPTETVSVRTGVSVRSVRRLRQRLNLSLFANRY